VSPQSPRGARRALTDRQAAELKTRLWGVKDSRYDETLAAEYGVSEGVIRSLREQRTYRGVVALHAMAWMAHDPAQPLTEPEMGWEACWADWEERQARHAAHLRESRALERQLWGTPSYTRW
jgi:hypothetical protein